MEYEVRKIEVYKVGDKLFEDESSARKHIAFIKNDKIIQLASSKRKNKVSAILVEMLEQGIHNKNKILNLIKQLEKNGY